jgi:hypothetical protein
MSEETEINLLGGMRGKFSHNKKEDCGWGSVFQAERSAHAEGACCI